MEQTLKQIEQLINDHEIVLFMKGTSTMPQCGFSGTVVQILNRLQVAFHDVNVLDDENIRQGIKSFTNWPTIPQLYIKGEFVGGCDIVKELYQSGELQKLLSDKGIAV